MDKKEWQEPFRGEMGKLLSLPFQNATQSEVNQVAGKYFAASLSSITAFMYTFRSNSFVIILI
jgi:hypothetical protein